MKSEMSPTPNPASWNDPIFILGIMQRSGTNFLYELLRLHRDCDISVTLWEDHLVRYTNLLMKYANSVYNHWNPTWGVDERLKDLLCQCIGNGLLSFLSAHNKGKRLLTKTPSVRNIKYFFKLFPGAYLIILVRDGRAIVESGVKSFGWDYEAATRRWVEAAHTIIQFDERNKPNPDSKYLIIRYEDLWKNLDKELHKIFGFLGLDVDTYDFNVARDLPIRGSSQLRLEGNESVHWNPMKKTQNFNPLVRWHYWNRALHERFNWIAGKYLKQLGYEEKSYTTNRFLWKAWNRMMDIKWRSRSFLGPVFHDLIRIIGRTRRRLFQTTLQK
jgi:hypothetical protein